MTTVGQELNRKVLIRLHLNAAASVTAALWLGRRRVARHRWQVSAGKDLVRLVVPLRVGAGTYQVRVTLRPVNGPTESFSRRVHLGR